METDCLDVEKLKRKLRKKLRQIENLEVVERELNDEELDKVRKKTEIRAQLGELVRQTETVNTDDNSDSDTEKEMKRSHENNISGTSFDQASSVKKVCKEPSLNANISGEIVPSLNQVKVSSEQQCVNDQSITDLNVSSEYSSIGDWELVSRPETSTAQQHGEIQVTHPSSKSDNVGVNKSDKKESILSSKPNKIPDRSQSSSQQPQTLPNQCSSTKSTTTKPASKPIKDPESEKIKKSSWKVTPLIGHEDLVLDCDIDLELGIAVTCSRDTTVKVWNILTASLLHSLRGHTGSVTGLCLLSSNQTNLLKTDEDNTTNHVAVSGSQDCSIKVWDLETEKVITSIYTYNGITRLVTVPNLAQTISGTDGGKLEVFCLSSSRCLVSQRVQEDSVTALASRLEGDGRLLLAVGGRDGVVKVYRLEAERFSCVFVLEDVRTEEDTMVHCRPVCALEIAASGLLYLGDHGCNLKLLDWKKNSLRKVSNHQQDLGFTDCLAREAGVLVASTYDLDTGEGGVNIFLESGTGLKYLSTLREDEEGRVFCVTIKGEPGALVVLTCGQEVKLWRQGAEGGIRSKTLNLNHRMDSGSEGEDEISDDDEEENQREELPYNQKPSGFCNCVMM